MPGVDLHVVPYASDNYGYILHNRDEKLYVLVDPADPDMVQKVLDHFGITQQGSELQYILVTHKHWDHAGGNAFYAEKYPGISIYGGEHDHVEKCNHPLSDQEEVLFKGQSKFRTLFTPCHTKGHVCYYLDCSADGGKRILFTGDTIFHCGLGRFFEGTAEDMHKILCLTLFKLPEDTLLFFGHEYAEDNLNFALFIDPENPEFLRELEEAKKKTEMSYPFTGVSIEVEKQVNIFMRMSDYKLQEILGVGGEVEVLATLREKKDNKEHKKENKEKL